MASITEEVSLPIPGISKGLQAAVPAIRSAVNAPIPSITAEVNFAPVSPSSTFFTIQINNGATGFTLPLIAGPVYNFFVDWGDGSSNHITAWNQAQATHTYADNSLYIVQINGAMPVWKFAGAGSCAKLIKILSWGPGPWSSMESSFQGCVNLDEIASGADFSGCVDFFAAFDGCASITIFPLFSFPDGLIFSAFLRGCTSLLAFPAIQFNSLATAAGTFEGCSSLALIEGADFGQMVGPGPPPFFDGCVSLASILATGFFQDFSVANCNMGAAALNFLFTQLDAFVFAKTLTVTGNPGTGTCNTGLAPAGWTIVT